jgi:hypothetical protein
MSGIGPHREELGTYAENQKAAAENNRELGRFLLCSAQFNGSAPLFLHNYPKPYFQSKSS